MPIVVNLDVMMAKRKLSLNTLHEMVGITHSNLSFLKMGKSRAVRFSTLNAICKVLACQPGDLLEYVDETTYEMLYPDREWKEKDDYDESTIA